MQCHPSQILYFIELMVRSTHVSYTYRPPRRAIATFSKICNC